MTDCKVSINCLMLRNPPLTSLYKNSDSDNKQPSAAIPYNGVRAHLETEVKGGAKMVFATWNPFCHSFDPLYTNRDSDTTLFQSSRYTVRAHLSL